MAQLKYLNDDCLLEVLDLLPPKEVFKMIRVDKRFNRLAKDKLRTNIKAIALRHFGSNNVDNLFSNCSHFGSINQNQVLVLKFNDMRDPSTKTSFLAVLAKCPGIKAVDFENFKFPTDILLDVVRLCPEFECFKLLNLAQASSSCSIVEEQQWTDVLDQIGHKLVHFEFTRFGLFIMDNRKELWQADDQLLSTVAAKCPNIKQLNANLYWNYAWPLSNVLMSAFKTLPKSCWITLKCYFLKRPESGEVFDDIFDELTAETADLSALGCRYDRLTKLKAKTCINQAVDGINFTGLKKLKVKLFETRNSINCLINSRFPCLEEFDFNAFYFFEDDYHRLFQKMSSIKKLIIYCDYDFNPKIPQSAIRRLNKLEKIQVKP